MNKRNLLLITGGAAAIYYLGVKAFNIKEAVKKLSATNPKLTAKPGINILQAVFEMSLDIANPGSTNIPFEYYAGTIIYEGSKIADFNFNGSGMVLKARSKTPIRFTVTISNTKFILSLIKIINAISRKQKVNSTFAINSSIYAAGADVPINFVYDIASQEVISGIGKVRFLQKNTQQIKARRVKRHRLNIPQPPLIVPQPEVLLQSPAATQDAPASLAPASTPAEQVKAIVEPAAATPTPPEEQPNN